MANNPRTARNASKHARRAAAGLCAGLICCGIGCPVRGQTTNLISGTLAEDAAWSGVCLLEGTVNVEPAVTLSIAPGTRVLLKPGAGLRVRGRLLADGTEAEPILFTHELDGARWERIQFIEAAPSRFRHCAIEYSDCAGDHKDYYDDDCDPDTPPPPRAYHEAVVVLASHVDFEGCLFQNLPSNTGSREGDALAIVSDDPVHPGPASATVRHCRFIDIGQGVHTRFAYVLVEGCYFTSHNGDNDDVDLYGESIPPPLIRNNLFLDPSSDDMINPTRCSAIIINNVIGGSPDHGIVLRDPCAPIVVNNLVFDCANGGFAIQNQCDALLLNNTIVNCGRGVRFFDHTGRWGPPYCLSPGSGRATLVNCIVWNCPTSLELTDSPYPEDRGSHATVRHSIVQGGAAGVSVSANSTLTWGEGNLETAPEFGADYRLLPGSAGLDAGVDPATWFPDLAALLSADLEGVPRPLDSDGDGTPAFDVGAYEYLLETADSNGDGIPDGWCRSFGFSPIDPAVADGDPDADSHTTYAEWIADTDPTDPRSRLTVRTLGDTPPLRLEFQSSANRRYTLVRAPGLDPEFNWTEVPGQQSVPGTGQPLVLSDPQPATPAFYRVRVQLP